MLVRQEPPAELRPLYYNIALAITLGLSFLNVLALGMLIVSPTSSGNAFYMSLMSLLSIMMWVGLFAVKREHAGKTTLLVGLPLLASTVVGLLVDGSALIAIVSYCIPLIVASMFLSARHVWAVLGLCLVLSAEIIILDVRGFDSPIVPGSPLYVCGVATVLLTMVLTTVFSVKGREALREAQLAAERQARELEVTQQALYERQQELEAAQQQLNKHNKALQYKLMTVGELGLGVVPFAPGVLIVPVFEQVLLDMAHTVRARLLAACTFQDAKIVIMHLSKVDIRPAAVVVLTQTLESIAALNVEVIVAGEYEALGTLPPEIKCVASLKEALLALEAETNEIEAQAQAA